LTDSNYSSVASIAPNVLAMVEKFVYLHHKDIAASQRHSWSIHAGRRHAAMWRFNLIPFGLSQLRTP